MNIRVDLDTKIDQRMFNDLNRILMNIKIEFF